MAFLRHLILITVLFGSVLGCKTLFPEATEVENLQMALPIPEEGWKVSGNNRGTSVFQKWSKENENLILQITRKKPTKSPQSMRLVLDKYTEENLAIDFSSTTLLEDTINNYPRIVWQTKADIRNYGKTCTIALLIHGNDASYLISKQWKNENEFNAEKAFWLKYLTSIEVTDPRQPKHSNNKILTPAKGAIPQSSNY